MEHRFTKPVALLGVSLFMATTFATTYHAHADIKPTNDAAEYTETWTKGKDTTYTFKDGFKVHYNDNRGAKDGQLKPSVIGKTEPIGKHTAQKLHAVPKGPHAEYTESWRKGKGTTYTLPDGYKFHYNDDRGVYDHAQHATKLTYRSPKTNVTKKHVKKATVQFEVKVKSNKVYTYPSTDVKNHANRKIEPKNTILKVYAIVKKGHKTFYKVAHHRFVVASKHQLAYYYHAK